MENSSNLIYNGNLAHGSDGWNFNGSNFYGDFSDSANGSHGALVFSGSSNYSGPCSSIHIPINTAMTYTMTADVKKDNISGGSNNLFSIISYDKYGAQIGPSDVFHTGTTTLARDLKDGDTVIYLTSAAGWWNSTTYRRIGICESPAFGYKRHIVSQYYESTSVNTTNNTITLRSGQSWTGGTWSAGTKVACFTDSSTWIYPINVTSSDENTWHTKTGSIPPGDWTTNGWRMGTDYVVVGMICYKDNAYRIANWSLENQSSFQIRKSSKGEAHNSIKKTGVVENTNNLEVSSIKVRYIRDWLSGSTANVDNHWVEIRAFDIYGRNVAFASVGSGCTNTGALTAPVGIYMAAPNVSNNPHFKKFHVITRANEGTPSASPYLYVSSTRVSGVVIDLGYEHELTNIQIWHYWADGRTYFGTKTEVSTDKSNWTTVFDSAVSGRYAETSAGHTIDLGGYSNMSMTAGGEYHSSIFYEI